MSMQQLGTPVADPPTPASPVVMSVTGLCKSYGPKVVLRDITMRIHEGEIVGLLGPNGTGKTTFLECVEGIRRLDAGTVSIAGVSPADGPARYHMTFGAQLQESSLPDRLRVREAMTLFSAFYDEPWDADDLLDRVGLQESQRVEFRRLSGGQKRRLTLALALLGKPAVVLLDEPTSGLDPHARLELWEVLQRLAGNRTAVLLATHDMHEAQERCNRVNVLDGGRIVAQGSVPELLRECGLTTRIRTTDVPWVDGLLRVLPGWASSQVVAGSHYAYGDAGFATAALAALGAHVTEAEDRDTAQRVFAGAVTGPAGLEDIYLIKTGTRYATD